MRIFKWAFMAMLLGMIVLTGCKHEKLDPDFSVERITYGPDARQQFDLFLPKKHDAKTPTVVLVPGGTWVTGVQTSSAASIFRGTLYPGTWDFVKPLIANDYAVVIMQYRLACYADNAADIDADPRNYPAEMSEDIDLVLNQLKSQAGVYGISSKKFGLLGEDTGGQIALQYAYQDSSLPELQTVVSFYAPTQFTDPTLIQQLQETRFQAISETFVRSKADNCEMTQGLEINALQALSSYVGKAIDPAQPDYSTLRAFSPAEPATSRRAIPTFILHGDDDLVIPVAQSEALISQLENEFAQVCDQERDFDCDYKQKTYPSCGHGWSGNDCNTQTICKDMVKWFDAHLK